MGADALQLDVFTAQRLLDGSMTRDDAPPGYRPVADLLETLRTPPTAADLRGEAEAVAAIAAVVAVSDERSVAAPRPGRLRRRGMAVAAGLAASATLFTGLAAANALPAAAQHVAAQVLSNLGVHVPDPGPRSHPSSGAHGETSHGAPSPVSTLPADTPTSASGEATASPSTDVVAPPDGPAGTGGATHDTGPETSTHGAPASGAPESTKPTTGSPSPEANGHSTVPPGNSGNAPGHDPNGPGNSENAPGHSPTGPGNSDSHGS
jgi:hypothetical protein